MCLGGGGGDAVEDQEEAERRRQARVQAVIGDINKTFADPALETQRQGFRQDVFNLNNRELLRQKDVGDRELRFHLARTGQAGGSADVDKNAELLRRFNEGTLQVSQKADEAANRLRVADEQARLNLQASAQAGIDSTTATQNALRAQKLNAQNAIGSNQIAAGTDFLGDVTSIFGNFQRNRGIEEARQNRSGGSGGPSPSNRGSQGLIRQ